MKYEVVEIFDDGSKGKYFLNEDKDIEYTSYTMKFHQNDDSISKFTLLKALWIYHEVIIRKYLSKDSYLKILVVE